MSIMIQPGFGKIFDLDSEEIWNYSNPKKGEHIRVSRGIYNHHGVYISNEEVIHFTGRNSDNVLDWSRNEVIKTDLDDFLHGGILEVKEYTEEELDDVYPVDHIVIYARACIGDKDYHLIFNNCEHFANTCTLGRFRSKQVEDVFAAILNGNKIPHGGENMGLLGKIGGAIKRFFGGENSNGSRSAFNTTYEPDKVKVAEIEADTKLRLAGMENERIELMKSARLELLEFETQSNIALEEAKARGLNFMVQTIVNMQVRLNEVAEKRLQIIEKGSMQIIREIESFYDELGDKIKADDDTYNTDKLPELLSLLEQYEIGTPSHELYKKRIEDDMMLQAKHYTMQIDAVAKRQTQIIDRFLQSKDRIIEQTGQITAGIIENIQNKYVTVSSSEDSNVEQAMLENRKNKMLKSLKELGGD